MAGGKKISQLDVDSELDGTEQVPLVDGQTLRTTTAAIAALASAVAAGVQYDNAESGLEATTVQDALDELAAGGDVVPDAVGDGAADDTGALQDAINAASVVGGAVRLEPDKTYRITSTLVVSSRVSIVGPRSAVVKMGGVNQSAIRVTSAASGVCLVGFTIDGNADGPGGNVNGDAGGHGIAISAATRVKVDDVGFRNIGIPPDDSVHGNYASPISANGTDALTVENCDFEETCHNRTGADVLVTGTNVLVRGNRSRSECDAFVNLAAIGTASGVNHLVCENFAYRAPSSIARSGVLYQYGGDKPSRSIIALNQIEGFVWHGVYGTAEASQPGGGVIVGENQIRYCGGGPADLDAGTGLWYGGGIRVGGIGGAMLHANIIEYCGYDSELSPRFQDASGIALQEGDGGTTANVTGHGNIVRHPRGPGVSIGATGDVASIELSGGFVESDTTHAILILAQATGVESIRNVTISGVHCKVSAADASAITVEGDNGAWSNRVHLTRNVCEHTNPGVSTRAGIYRDGYSTYDRFTGSVVDNDLIGFATAVQVVSIGINLFCPRAVLVARNRVTNCAQGMYVGAGATHWGVHIDTVGAATSNMNPGRSRPGRLVGALANTGTPRVEMLLPGAASSPSFLPTEGAWEVNDRIALEVPFGPIIGFRCSVAGTTGTWQPTYGPRLPARRSYQSISGSTTISAFGADALTLEGVAAAKAWATTSEYTRATRVGVEQTTPSTSAVAGFRSTAAVFNRQSGYYVRLRWAPHLGQTIATGRAFAGLIASTAAPTDVEPSSLLNMIGMGWDASDTQIQMMSNDGSGSATKTALGASWPVPSADDTNVYQLELFCPPSGGGTYYRVTNMVSGIAVAGALTADAPAGNLPLCGPHAYTSVGGTSGTTGLCLCEFEAESN